MKSQWQSVTGKPFGADFHMPVVVHARSRTSRAILTNSSLTKLIDQKLNKSGIYTSPFSGFPRELRILTWRKLKFPPSNDECCARVGVTEGCLKFPPSNDECCARVGVTEAFAKRMDWLANIRIHDEIRKARLSLFQGDPTWWLGMAWMATRFSSKVNKDLHLLQSTPMKLQIEEQKGRPEHAGSRGANAWTPAWNCAVHVILLDLYTFRALVELLEQNCHDSKNAMHRSKCKFAAAIYLAQAASIRRATVENPTLLYEVLATSAPWHYRKLTSHYSSDSRPLKQQLVIVKWAYSLSFRENGRHDCLGRRFSTSENVCQECGRMERG